MRLTCPNCGAQYEVPDAVIPASGRDVQCSNCGTTWFQQHPEHAAPEPDEAETAPDPEAAPETNEPPEAAPQPAPPTGKRLDPSVTDILREEAERERAARAAEAGGRIETQPDLGLADPEPDEARRAREAQDRMQRLRGGHPGDHDETAPKSGNRDNDDGEFFDDDEDDEDRLGPRSRRNLFPDIDEINSSLTASEDGIASLAPVMADEVSSAGRRGGFRSGFRLAVVLSVAALAIYLMAPRISGLWPAAEAPLAHYVAAVDDLRAMLSGAVADLIARF